MKIDNPSENDKLFPEYNLAELFNAGVTEKTAHYSAETGCALMLPYEIQDDLIWEAQFERTQSRLVAAARQAKQQISECLAKPCIWA